MRRHWIAAGLILQALAGLLTAAGHHDGLLGATPASEFPFPGEEAVAGTVRVVIEEATVPPAQSGLFLGKDLVPARLESGPEPTLVYVGLDAARPAPGTTLVIDGRIASHVLEDGSSVLLIIAEDTRAPIFFK